jgi:DNA-binding NarL/FixJ family response regulator
MKLRIFLVDDHPIVRHGLKALINPEKDMEVIGESGDANSALLLVQNDCPDMIIVDIQLGKTNGIELIKNVRSMFKNLIILVISLHDDVIFVERALQAGASGYILKS